MICTSNYNPLQWSAKITTNVSHLPAFTVQENVVGLWVHQVWEFCPRQPLLFSRPASGTCVRGLIRKLAISRDLLLQEHSSKLCLRVPAVVMLTIWPVFWSFFVLRKLLLVPTGQILIMNEYGWFPTPKRVLPNCTYCSVWNLGTVH